MDNAEYTKRIEQAYQVEVGGEVFFATLERYSKTPEERYKLSAMRQLETETKGKLKKLVVRLHGNTREDETYRVQGIDQARRLSDRSWSEFLAFLHSEAGKYAADYENLERVGPKEDADLLAHLTQHEQSFLKFVELERLGQSGRSIEPVLELLSKHPAGS